jgi:sulfatase maturation enzyme AslB (radical SAM superfamily)
MPIPFYEIGSRLMRTDKAFLRRQLLNKQYGDPWLKGFGLMMKGVEKYGVRIPFTPAGPFEIVWNVTSQCNRKCKHCYENAGGKRRGELSRKSGQNFLVEAHYASK